MSLRKERTHSFIVRLWRELREIEHAAAEWRGLIIHVQSGQQRYFKDPEAIIDFLRPFMEVGDSSFTTPALLEERFRLLMLGIEQNPSLLPPLENGNAPGPMPPGTIVTPQAKGEIIMNETEWSLELKIEEGPKFKQKGKFLVEGYDKIDVVVPADSSWQVNVQPGDLDAIQLLFIIRTDQPQPPAEGEEPADRTLYYTIGNNPNQIELTDLHVVLGAGAIKLLCDAPNEICFHNEGDQDAEVTILICRRTSAPCEPGEEPLPEELPKKETTGEGPKQESPQTTHQVYPEKTQQPPKG